MTIKKEIYDYCNSHPLLKSMVKTSNEDIYTEELFNTLESHIPRLLASNLVKAEVVDFSQASAYSGDFYGYLRKYQPNVPYELYWLCCRLSSMNGPADFNTGVKNIYLILSVSIVNNLINSQKVISKTPF